MKISDFGFLILCFGFICGCSHQPLYKETRLMMGTYCEVISPDSRAAKIAFDEISRIENLVSKYKTESEISKLNSAGQITASPEVFYLIKKAKEFSQASAGAFDITVGPLVGLWGFSDQKYSVPDPAKIKGALRLTGSDKIELNESNNVIKFKLPGMKIDPGGIAKGFAVDCAINKLKKTGIRSCLVRCGGNIYCLGDCLGKTWKVAIQNPSGPGTSGCLYLKDGAVDTSGGYEQSFVKDAGIYSHILNPKTGYPADSGLASVTVMGQDCVTADALATAIFVLGEKKGRELAAKFTGVNLYLIKKNDPKA